MYDPTLQANPMEKVGFYTDLRRFIQKVPPNETVIILGETQFEDNLHASSIPALAYH
ncbi:hypothetical protein LOAG_11691 [Loa loa]|uniref:Uncharacterized protein n=1 Tax=Loa loa TaxID=7209 RepID=A0A1S0TNS7_LOALO|nr:hypothetical protein LOAG_11691 [Loa loa]EFO16816.1 hypothetical protein LOAG_11691 [Loa loa]